MEFKKKVIGTLFGILSAGVFVSSANAAFTVCDSGVVTKAENSYQTANPYFITIRCDDTSKWAAGTDGKGMIFMVGATDQADPQGVYATALTAISTGYKVKVGVGNNVAYARLLTMSLIAP